MIYAAACYALLANDDHSVRENAERALVRLVDGWPHIYGARVEAWAKEASHPEVSHRVRRALLPYAVPKANALADAYRPPTPVWPCIDGYTGANTPVIAKWFVAAGWKAEDSDEDPHYTRWRRASEMWARDAIRKGDDPAEVDEILAGMWRTETAFHPERKKWTWAGGYP